MSADRWQAFEDLVFEAAKKALFSSGGARVQVERNRKGPIDIVITVRRRAPDVGSRPLPGFSTQTAYIECKHYNRPLEFADAAKVFCVAIREPPNVLMIVSSRDMGPQAWEYAQYFFTVDDRPGIFGNIHFAHWRLAELLGSAAAEVLLPPPEETAAPPPRRWVLRVSDAFTNRIAASSDTVESVTFDARKAYALEITPGACTHDFVIDVVRDGAVELRLRGACAPSTRKSRIKTVCTIPPDSLGALPDGARIALSIDCKTSGQFTVSLGKLAPHGGGTLIDDLRSDTTAAWIARLADPAGPNVLVIGGEGGVGKTYLSLKLCTALYAQRDYCCLKITVTPDSSESIFFRVLWWLIVPEFGEAAEPPDRELLAASLERLLADDRRADAEVVARLLTDGELHAVDVEVLTFLCARLLSQNPRRRMLLLSNAHHLAPRVVRALELLFSAIADVGWGDTRLLLEYRTGYDNPRFGELVDRLRSDTQRVAFADVRPLSETELAVALESRVSAEHRNNFAHAIYRKAGGNALFVTNVLLWAIDEGYVTRDNQRVRINDAPGFERELSRLPAVLDHFLDSRIGSVLKRADGRTVLSYLTAAAFGGFEIDAAQVQRLTELQPSEIDAARIYLCAKEIVSESIAGPQPTFAHEIMMLSARSAVAKQRAFVEAASRILARLDSAVFDDTLLGGRLSSALGRDRAAFDFYNRGYELACNAVAFHQQCLALEGAREVLAPSHTGTTDLTRRYAEIELSLAEAELLGGSMVRADRALREVLDVAAREESAWPVCGETRLWRCRALSQRIQLFVRLMKPREALQAFGELLSIFQYAPSAPHFLRSAMTRILLTLAMSSRPADARQVADALLASWNDMSSNEQSSLCSDIGRIYLQSNLDVAAEWWHRGVSLGTEARQMAHSRLNAFIVELLRGAPPPDDVIRELRRRATELGVDNQVARIDLTVAVLAERAGDDEQARHTTNLALRLSRSTSQVSWEWKALNNLGVLAMKQRRRDEAARLFEDALSMTAELRDFGTSGPLEAGVLGPFTSAAHSELPAPPQHSGLWHLLVHNARIANGGSAPPFDRVLPALANGPLRVDSDTGPLYFALE